MSNEYVPPTSTQISEEESQALIAEKEEAGELGNFPDSPAPPP